MGYGGGGDAGTVGLVTKTRLPAVDGLFTEVDGVARLIGAKVPGRESYFFPAHLPGMAGGDPAVVGAELEEVLLSPTGTVWSYTTSSYAPPPPFVANTDPYEPITIAAVRLEKEEMVVLGQCVQGVTPADLEIGMVMELVIEKILMTTMMESMMTSTPYRQILQRP